MEGAGSIESWGLGIEKMRDLCVAKGVPAPAFRYEEVGFWVEFSLLVKKLGETRSAIMAAMMNDRNITVKKLAERLEISTTAIEKNIQYLRQHGYVQRIGPRNGGHWEVKGEDHGQHRQT